MIIYFFCLYFRPTSLDRNTIYSPPFMGGARGWVFYIIKSYSIPSIIEAGARLSTYVNKDEFIIAVSGSTTGKFCRLGISGYIYDGLAAILNPQKIITGEYLSIFFSWVYQILNSQKIGSAFPNINTDVLNKTLIPIPPLPEQERIVDRVNELLAMCDELKGLYE